MKIYVHSYEFGFKKKLITREVEVIETEKQYKKTDRGDSLPDYRNTIKKDEIDHMFHCYSSFKMVLLTPDTERFKREVMECKRKEIDSLVEKIREAEKFIEELGEAHE